MGRFCWCTAHQWQRGACFHLNACCLLFIRNLNVFMPNHAFSQIRLTPCKVDFTFAPKYLFSVELTGVLLPMSNGVNAKSCYLLQYLIAL